MSDTLMDMRTMGAKPRQDVLLAGTVGLAGLGEVWLGGFPADRAVATLSLLVMTAALMVRRVRPRVSLVLVLLALTFQSFLGVPVNAQLMTIPFILLAAYSVGAHLDRSASAVGLAIGAALAAAAIAAAHAAGSTDPAGSDFGFGVLMVTGPWIAGVLVRARYAAETEAVSTAEHRAEQAADEERERIARELHDIVSHGLSAMVVQAAAAAELVDRSPDAARRAMHEVQATGAEAMTEMRHLLALTRRGGSVERRPQPALDDVHQLVVAEQGTGRRVSLAVRGTPRELPRGLALSIFRIVQESLTNVRKHAPESRCEVTITYTADTVEVEVADDGTGSRSADSGGLGIIGMGERARLYGGTLEAGPRSPGGGWVVRGRFPLEHLAVGS